MIENIFYVTGCRFHVYDKNILFIAGTFRNNNMYDEKIIITLNGENLDVSIRNMRLIFHIHWDKICLLNNITYG